VAVGRGTGPTVTSHARPVGVALCRSTMLLSRAQSGRIGGGGSPSEEDPYLCIAADGQMNSA
jgi:hypothetical protein